MAGETLWASIEPVLHFVFLPYKTAGEISMRARLKFGGSYSILIKSGREKEGFQNRGFEKRGGWSSRAAVLLLLLYIYRV
jgi:hypothetical protein